jgi:hypothetical protein
MDVRYAEEFLAGRYGRGARDQRLEEFAQGRWGDRARPSGWLASGWLALQACDVSRPEVLADATGDELLGIGRAWKSLEAWSFTGKLAVVRELIRRFPLNEDDEPGAAAGGLPDEWDPRLHHEVAAALVISVAAAGKLVNLAWTLDSRLPGIRAALEEDRLDPPRVKMIVDETSVLDGEQMFASAEAIILAGLDRCKTWSDLQRRVQRAVITVDPDGARKRREQAEREHARIRFWRESTGTCALRGTGLPTDEALAATANIEARALEYKAAPIKRPMDILRVMAYLDLINGVTVMQRAVWVQAEDEARAAEADPAAADEQAARDAGLREATRRAREKLREKAREGARRDNASSGQDPSDGEPDDPRDGPDDWPPSGDGPGGSGGGRPPGIRPDDTDGPGGFPDWRPGDGGLGDGCPANEGDGGPGGTGLESDPKGAGQVGGCDGDSDGEGPRPYAGGTEPASAGRGGGPCPQCGGAGGIVGLAVRANLTLPAEALQWLAGRAGAERDPAATGRGAPGSATKGLREGSSRDSGPRSRAGPGAGFRGDPGPCPACGNRGNERMPGGSSLPIPGNLTFPLLTLLDLAQRPGEAQGFGALDPALVRALAAAGARHPASEFCVTIIDEQGHAIGHGCGKPLLRPLGAAGRNASRGPAPPVPPGPRDKVTFTPAGKPGPSGGFGSWELTLPGAPLRFAVGIDVVPAYECDHRHASTGYQPGGKLRHLVQVRDGACSFPACSRHARESDFEHAQPFDKGGATCACNAHACSRACHQVKQSPGWQVTKPRPGWTQWTTMTGRSYLQGPWRYPS